MTSQSPHTEKPNTSAQILLLLWIFLGGTCWRRSIDEKIGKNGTRIPKGIRRESGRFVRTRMAWQGRNILIIKLNLIRIFYHILYATAHGTHVLFPSSLEVSSIEAILNRVIFFDRRGNFLSSGHPGPRGPM
jgi:hypothetical protein